MLINPKVAIILVNYNGWEDSLVCLESILKQGYDNFNIFLIDNNSSDNSIENIINWYKKEERQNKAFYLKLNVLNSGEKLNVSGAEIKKELFLIKSLKNGGFAAGNNIGIRFALNYINSDFIWLLNNDTYIEKFALTELVNRMNDEKVNNRKTGILGSKILDYINTDQIQSVGFKYNKFLAVARPIGKGEVDSGQYNSKDIKMDYMMGASMFINSDFIKDVGLMNEEYFLYFEELDWILRGRKRGWDIGYEYKSKVYHKQGATTNIKAQAKNRSEFGDYYQVRNRILFTKRFYPYYLILVYVSLIVSITKRLKAREYKNAKNILKILFRK